MREEEYKFLVEQHKACQQNIILQEGAWKRFSIFFTVNSSLTVFVGLFPILFENLSNLYLLVFVGVLLIVFGFLFNFVWLSITKKGIENVKHWPKLMRELEAEMNNIINNTKSKKEIFMLYTLGFEYKKKIKEEKKKKRRTVNKSEEKEQKIMQEKVLFVPIFMMILWMVIGIILIFIIAPN